MENNTMLVLAVLGMALVFLASAYSQGVELATGKPMSKLRLKVLAALIFGIWALGFRLATSMFDNRPGIILMAIITVLTVAAGLDRIRIELPQGGSSRRDDEPEPPA